MSDADKTILEQPEDDMPKTEALKGKSEVEEKPKKVKGKDEWQTVQTPKVKRAAPAPTPSAPPAAAPAEKPKEAMPASPPMGTSPAPSAPPVAQAPAAPVGAGATSSVPLGSTLANMGIKDEQTQKIVVFGGGGLLLLCCLCSCVGIAWTLLGPALFQ